jgi:hypothetical protein
VVTATATGTATGGGSSNLTARDTNAVVVLPIRVDCQMSVSTNGGASFFVPSSICPTQQVGSSYIVRIVVTNSGAYPLGPVNVVPVNGGCPAGPVNVGPLALGGTATIFCTNTCTQAGVNEFAVTVNARASQAQGRVCDHNNNGQPIIARSQCATCVACFTPEPKICITKEVVCQLPSGCETNWRELAIGVRNAEGNECPTFCYRITVRNCGQETLTNVVVSDNVISTELAAQYCFPSVLTVGQSVSCIITNVEHCTGVTNTATATGVGQISGIQVSTNDTAAVLVREIDIECTAYINGSTSPSALECDGLPHLITNSVRICNVGDLPVVAWIDEASVFSGALLCTNFQNVPLALNPGECTEIVLCSDVVTCQPTCGVAWTNAVHAIAVVDLSKTNVCAYTRNASNELVLVSTETECDAEIGCIAPNACRVTGGGRQDDPLTFPDNVRYVTHGGQVGAPVGIQVCEVTDDFYLGNPCIHGRWTHVRHVQGGLRGNFHARYYDTLDCICLNTTLTATNFSVTGPAGTQNYTNLVWGLGTVTDGSCNPDDHKVAGPQPRPAGANKIVFTGVGDWADPNGRRAPRACLFRVDIEDRSEPGGSHPKGGVDPADRYRIRIWVLSNQELALLRGGGSGAAKYLKGFRSAIGACNGLNVRDGASVPNGTAAFGVRAPDIDDGGVLERGNHQIHPAIKNCDPYNPTGPGLPGREVNP